jgi:hypothetical protein
MHFDGLAMKIAQVAQLAESVPPILYGGTERIVSYLTEELVRQGHDVTLFASGDSITAAELVPCAEMALRPERMAADYVAIYRTLGTAKPQDFGIRRGRGGDRPLSLVA